MPTKTPTPLHPIESASRDEIAALQLQRLKWSLRHAYDNVPHYRKAFDDKGVHPNDLQTLADLAKFPFMTKLDLRDNYPFGLFAVPRQNVVDLRRMRQRIVNRQNGATGNAGHCSHTLPLKQTNHDLRAGQGFWCC